MTFPISKFPSLLVSSTLLLGLAIEAAAQTAPTFYTDALPVFEKNCVACHQPEGPDVGGISAPMSLMDFDQAKIWAPLIKNAP
jgi:mono/diheme cytochrome c family protein